MTPHNDCGQGPSICNVNISCRPVVAWWQPWHKVTSDHTLLTLPHLQSRNLGSNEQHSQIVILTVEDSYLVVSSPAWMAALMISLLARVCAPAGPAYLKTINIRPICFVSLQLLIKYLPQFQGHFSSTAHLLPRLAWSPEYRTTKFPCSHPSLHLSCMLFLNWQVQMLVSPLGNH